MNLRPIKIPLPANPLEKNQLFTVSGSVSWWDVRSIFSFTNPEVVAQEVSSRTLEIPGITSNVFPDVYFPLIGNKKQKSIMIDPQSRTHTIRSHGVAVARMHKHDWLILVVLGVILLVLSRIHPFHRFVGKDMMTDLKYPLKSNTIPMWAVPIYAVLLPIIIFSIIYFRRRDVYDLHHAILGLLFSVLITGVVTNAIKDAVGRPRPDFFWRCFSDGKAVYDKLGDVICNGDRSVIREGYKSFPSGHTSWSFAGLGFLSLYLAGKIKVFDRKGHVAKLCIVLLPLLLASLVGISRVDDYWHHWQDVFAGGLIGLTVATFCYLQFFAPPYHAEGWGPYAYFRVLEESRVTVQASEVLASGNMEATEAQFANQQPERNGNELRIVTSSGDSVVALDDLESGGR